MLLQFAIGQASRYCDRRIKYLDIAAPLIVFLCRMCYIYYGLLLHKIYSILEEYVMHGYLDGSLRLFLEDEGLSVESGRVSVYLEDEETVLMTLEDEGLADEDPFTKLSFTFKGSNDANSIKLGLSSPHLTSLIECMVRALVADSERQQAIEKELRDGLRQLQQGE